MRTMALPEAVEHWPLTSLWEKLIKIGTRIVGHGRCFAFRMAEVAVSGGLFGKFRNCPLYFEHRQLPPKAVPDADAADRQG